MNNIINKLNQLENETLDNLKISKSYNTLKSYSSDFNDFKIFCSKYNFQAIPANEKTISLYLTYLSKFSKFSTLKRRIVSISVVHKLKGFHIDIKNPIISENLNGIKRSIGIYQESKKPLLINNLKEIIDILDKEKVNKLKILRDKTILLIAFSGGFRRSEVVDINYEDLEFVKEGLKIIIKKSKTDQFSEGMLKAIPYFDNQKYCPVANLKLFTELAQINSGPIFRRFRKNNMMTNERLTDQSMALILKFYLKRIGIDSTNYSGHSFRSGFATVAADAGADERSIMNMTGHKTVQMVRRYIKDVNIFKNNALSKIKF